MSESNSLDFQELFRRWAFEGIDSISLIKGYSELLLNESSLGSLTEQQREIIKAIHQCSLGAQDHWRDSLYYLNIQGEKRLPHLMLWKRMSLPEVITSAMSNLKSYGIGEIKIEIPDSFPLLRVNEWLVLGIANLILPRTRPRLSTYPILVKGYVLERNQVMIQISTNIMEIEAGYIEKEGLEDFLFNPGSRLLTTRLILEKLYKNNLEVRVTSTGLECEFSVPVSSLSEDSPLEILLSMENNGQNIELILGQELIVNLPHIGQVECDAEILLRAGFKGRSSASGHEYYEVRFWPMETGLTPLKITYHSEASSEDETFSVFVKIIK